MMRFELVVSDANWQRAYSGFATASNAGVVFRCERLPNVAFRASEGEVTR